MGMNCSRCDILQSESQNEVTRNSIKQRNDKHCSISYISNDLSSFIKDEKKIITIQRKIRQYLNHNQSNRSHIPNMSLEKLHPGALVSKTKNEFSRILGIKKDFNAWDFPQEIQ